jgi:ABC-2 type transport system permease protein
VLALLIQHMAVALGALSLVRERMLGSLELFRVAPVSPFQMLVGKYLGYIIFTAALILLLTLMLVFGLQVPFLGNVWWFVGEAVLLILASLGIGFTISAISSTDSQAVQLSMLVLLLSIFFGGFFLPLDSFAPWVRGISYALPLTHGITAFQHEMLQGGAMHDYFPLIGMAAISIITFSIALFGTAQQFRRV